MGYINERGTVIFDDSDRLAHLRGENERLRAELKASDLQHIRLRAGLREALEIGERIERDSGNWRGRDRERLAELRALLEVTP